LAKPDFNPVEKLGEFPLYTEKSEVLLPPFFHVAGKHAENTEEQQYYRQGI